MSLGETSELALWVFMRRSCLSISSILVTYWGIICSFSKCFYWKYVEQHFQNGGGIILLHGAPVKSKFDGLKIRKSRFSWFSNFIIFGCLGSDAWQMIWPTPRISLATPTYASMWQRQGMRLVIWLSCCRTSQQISCYWTALGKLETLPLRIFTI